MLEIDRQAYIIVTDLGIEHKIWKIGFLKNLSNKIKSEIQEGFKTSYMNMVLDYLHNKSSKT